MHSGYVQYLKGISFSFTFSSSKFPLNILRFASFGSLLAVAHLNISLSNIYHSRLLVIYEKGVLLTFSRKVSCVKPVSSFFISITFA